MRQIIVFKGVTNIVTVAFGFDISEDEITSQIREEKDSASDFIAEWVVTFDSDGTDGEVILTLDDSFSSNITKSKGFMDFKRIASGEPLAVIDEPIEVIFRPMITL